MAPNINHELCKQSICLASLNEVPKSESLLVAKT